jgi:hypothetical protein
MFAPNWFLTLFTRVVMDLSLLYELWEIFLYERDKYMIFYLGIAILKSRRQQILQLNQFEKLMKFLTSDDLKVNDFAQLGQIYSEAVSIRRNTPVSFELLVTKLHLFNQETCLSNEELTYLENFKGLPLGLM